ncbi:MAG TPA: TatD family hydrolase [Terriglobia bacterium]|nr:TatD family hydrolase [Terriglobia bacterium]
MDLAILPARTKNPYHSEAKGTEGSLLELLIGRPNFPMLIDSHAHLDLGDFDSDREAVLRRAQVGGIERILVIGGGGGPEPLDSAIELSSRYEQLDATVGIHPHEARRATGADFDWLDRLADHAKVVAWGEIGLDFHYDLSPRETQEDVFIRQLGLARAKELPVIIHSRDAEAKMLEILASHCRNDDPAGVLHCYTGSLATALRCLEMGFFISFSGILTFPKSRDLRDVARKIPSDRLLIETDSPYLAPVPYRGKRNEPVHVVEVARALAQVRETSMESIAEVTTNNYMRLLGRKVHAPPATPNEKSSLQQQVR